MTNKFSWTIVICLVCALGYFIYINREHSKIHEAITVAIAGLFAVVFGVIFLGGEKKEIKKMISSVSFVSLEKKEPVFLAAPILYEYHMWQSIIWTEFQRNHAQHASQLLKSLPEDTKEFSLFTELLAVAVMQYLGRSYNSDWDVLKTIRVLPGEKSILGQGLNTNPKDKKRFDSTELREIFSANKFKDSLDRINRLTLPKGTVIKYITSSENPQNHQIVISKKFSFTATINIYFTSYGVGLGKVANYIGITKPSNIWNVNWKERDKFGMVAVTIDCNAKFCSLKSGNPKLQLYKRWLENMFDNLYEEFDWSVCQNAMKEHFEELAHQQVINGLGEGFEQK
jgi:hypothetical protein